MPSNQRASDVEQYGEKAEDGLRDEGDGWVSTPAEHNAAVSEEEILPTAPAQQRAETAESDDDIPDIDDLALEGGEDDEVKTEIHSTLFCSRF